MSEIFMDNPLPNAQLDIEMVSAVPMEVNVSSGNPIEVQMGASTLDIHPDAVWVRDGRTEISTFVSQVIKPEIDDFSSAEQADIMMLSEQEQDAFKALSANKTTAFKELAAKETQTFETQADDRMQTFSNLVDNKTTDFKTLAESKTQAFETLSDDKITAFNQNATDKKTAFETLATTETQAFTLLAETETKTFNALTSEKTNEFKELSGTEMSDFKTLAESKTQAFETLSVTSQQNMEQAVDGARKWAIGTLEEQPAGSAHYWAEQAKAAVADNASETVVGVARLATTDEATIGTNDTTIMTPLKTAQIYASKATTLSGYGITDAYTQPQTDALLNAKANTSASNFSSAGKQTLSALSMPSTTKYTDLTLGTSGATYTAPANGWFLIDKSANDQEYIYIGSNSGVSFTLSASGVQAICASIPVSKGTVISVSYNTSRQTNRFRFIYAKGAEV